MNKLIAKILTCVIPFKQKRKQVRKFLMDFSFLEFFQSIIYAFIILYNKKYHATHYLIELNPFHTECMYSVFHVLPENIKKSIIILTRKENIELKLFPQYVKTKTIYPYTIKLLDKFNFFEKKSIFVNSYLVWEQQKTIEYYFKNFIKNNKLYCIDHNPEPYSHLKINQNIKKFVLADFLSIRFNHPSFYACFFPENENIENTNKKFISIGFIRDQSRRDMDTYFHTLETNPNMFSYIVGTTTTKYVSKLNTLNNINYLGRASFPDMFKALQQSVFLPFLIHDKTLGYYQQAISGNLNLILGFALIPIIDERLAKLYNLPPEACILYRGVSGFENACKDALKLTETEIRQKRICVQRLKLELSNKNKLALQHFIKF